MPPRTVAVLCSLLLLPALAGCSRKTSLKPDLALASAGQPVTILLDPPVKDASAVRARWGKQIIPILRTDKGMIQFIMPRGDTDSVVVEMLDGSRSLGSFAIRRQPEPAQRLLLSLDGETVTLRDRVPSNDAASVDARTRRTRLSFDVVNRHGTVVYSASIPHPAFEPVESFIVEGNDAHARTVTRTGPVVFPVWIPAHRDTVRLYVYEAAPGLDLMDSDGRARRRELAVLEVLP